MLSCVRVYHDAAWACWGDYGTHYLSLRRPGYDESVPDILTTLLPSASSSTNTMSKVPSTATSSTNFETIFTAALKEYKKQTQNDIASHPLATQLRSCDSSSAILAVLRIQVQTFDQSQTPDEKWTQWLDPTVNVLYAFSAALGNGVGVVSGRSAA
jgi:hypothetical protein